MVSATLKAEDDPELPIGQRLLTDAKRTSHLRQSTEIEIRQEVCFLCIASTLRAVRHLVRRILEAKRSWRRKVMRRRPRVAPHREMPIPFLFSDVGERIVTFADGQSGPPISDWCSASAVNEPVNRLTQHRRKLIFLN